MEQLNLTKEQFEEREALLESLYNTISLSVKKSPSSLANDEDLMDRLFTGHEYDYAIDAFWDYFKNKYNIGEVEKFYTDKKEMMRDIYVRCLIPFNLELDVMYGTDQNFKRQTLLSISRIWMWLKRIAQRWYIGLIGVVVLWIVCSLSYQYSLMNEVWLSSLLLGVAGSIFAALIVTGINRHIRRVVSKIEFQERFIGEKTTSYIEGFHRDSESFIKNDKNQGSQYMLDFVQINNKLKHFLDSIRRIEGITSLNVFIELVEFEKIIFDFSSNIVRREYVGRFDGVTPEERQVLRLKVFELTSLVDNFTQEIEEFLFSLRNELKHLNKKII